MQPPPYQGFHIVLADLHYHLASDAGRCVDSGVGVGRTPLVVRPFIQK